MAKKIEDAEVKKECPSCGLGVALDSTICEFCGWDFEEEDEWILQIEKLERELMLEKQKFEPGSVNQKIESTLHMPHGEKAKPVAAPQEELKPFPAPKAPPARAEPVVRTAETRPQKVVAPAPVSKPAPAKIVEPSRAVRTPEPTPEPEPSPSVRRVKSAPPAEPAEQATKTRKVRVVRKVKQ